MRKGFIFDHNRCVNCNACRAACVLENGLTIQPRTIFIYNSDAEDLFPLINLSMACSHCESAVCMKGCPASAYERDPLTGAVIVDEKKCIGCRYCQWNCPYDAPKFDSERNIVSKCNLCNTGLKEGREPACSSACPTGALAFGQLTHPEFENVYPWFPDKNLYPAIEFSASHNQVPPVIIPERTDRLLLVRSNEEKKNISSEFSLIMFSFLATLSVSVLISSVVKGVFPERFTFIVCLLLTGLVSFFHLGKKLRSWRSVINLRHSPLSREIAMLIFYSLISLSAVLLNSPGLLAASAIAGLCLLLLIDSVYLYADRRRSAMFQSGQTFISALLIGSFLSGILVPFIFIAIIKLISSVYSLSGKKSGGFNFGIRFLRLGFLVVPGLSMTFHNYDQDFIVVLILLSGELLDRILFYYDFNPVNINHLIDLQLNIERNEKKRG
jgi:Fe-S-cluster-containing dehydrogenase component/DMSO reductase anchor subunit